MNKKLTLNFEGEKHELATDETNSSESELSALLCGDAYNFKHQPERLKYVGKKGNWHQFEQIGKQGVWCELLDSDLHMIEKTTVT